MKITRSVRNLIEQRLKRKIVFNQSCREFIQAQKELTDEVIITLGEKSKAKVSYVDTIPAQFKYLNFARQYFKDHPKGNFKSLAKEWHKFKKIHNII